MAEGNLNKVAQEQIRKQALEMGLVDEYDQTPIGELRAVIRKKLRRYDDRKYSQTLYKDVRWPVGLSHSIAGDITLCCRYSYEDSCWDVGWAWRNPTDEPVKKEGRKYARKRMLEGVLGMLSGDRSNPPWEELLLLLALPPDGFPKPPRWTGGLRSRIYALDQCLYRLTEGCCF